MKNRGCLITLNVPHLRRKINKTCANHPLSCVNGEVRTEFGSLKEPAYRCMAALGRRACPLSRACARQLPLWGNGDDRRQWRKQGGAVGAAASRMRAAAKQTLGAATRAVSPKVTERARTLTESFSVPFCSKNFLKIHFIGLLFCYTPVRTKRHRREEE